MTTLRRRALLFLATACLPIVALALAEGFSSLAIFVATVRREGVAEAVHTERDTLLGWINLPNASRPDLYGPGLGLHTNGQRFRHNGELAPRAPAGKRRVVCSGDSFTLGYGVADTQTWCAQLEAADPSLETVNMGQGGYGLDQAYLWYIRDGLPLHADLHIVAFISADLRRMQYDRLNGYPKPSLAVDGDSVRVTGVPVRRPGLGPMIVRLTNAVRTLRMSEVLKRFLAATPKWSDPTPKDSATWEVARAALRSLARRDSANGTALVVVALPMLDDYQGTEADGWRRWARQAASRGEFRFLDLIDAVRLVRPDSVPGLFIPPGEAAFHGAAGHYTPAGNSWVTAQLRRAVPELASAPLRAR